MTHRTMSERSTSELRPAPHRDYATSHLHSDHPPIKNLSSDLMYLVHICQASFLKLLIREKGRKTLFNHTLNTFYVPLYGIIMVKYQSDIERGNPLLLHHGLLILVAARDILYTQTRSEM